MERWMPDNARDILSLLNDGRFAQVTNDIERLTGRPPRATDAFLEENPGLWRRCATYATGHCLSS
jgi:hypothetical protein